MIAVYFKTKREGKNAKFYIAREYKDRNGIPRLTYSFKRHILFNSKEHAKVFVKRHQTIGNIEGRPEYIIINP